MQCSAFLQQLGELVGRGWLIRSPGCKCCSFSGNGRVDDRSFFLFWKVIISAHRPEQAKAESGQIERAMEDLEHVELITTENEV